MSFSRHSLRGHLLTLLASVRHARCVLRVPLLASAWAGSVHRCSTAYTAIMARTLYHALLLAVMTASAVAQTEPTVTPPPAAVAKSPAAAPTGRIVGTVLCADTHRPARGATLLVSAVPAAEGSNTRMPGTTMGRVALDGTYMVQHLPPGEYTVVAMLQGYLSHMDDFMSEGAPPSPADMRERLLRWGTVTITGGEAERFDITLERGAALSGQVVFSDGAPATQVSMDIEDVNAKKLTGESETQMRMGTAMSRTLFTHQSQNTDDQGRFRISGLRPGKYRIAAVSSLSNQEDANQDMGGMIALMGNLFDPSSLRIYSGDTLHRKAAKVYEVRAGDEINGIEITIPLNAFHFVKGTLTAKDGRAINKATITLTDVADDSVTYLTDVSEQGSFAFATVAAGTYTLSAKGARILTRIAGADQDLPMAQSPTRETGAFADGSTSVIVKDSDVTDVSLTLVEVPLAPDSNAPQTPSPED